jgi:hypothetical protein
MTVRNACHDEIPAPTGWDLTADECMACSRTDETPQEFARRELLTGKQPNRVCAKGISKKALRLMQKELVESGDLDPGVLKPSANERKAAADEPKLPLVRELLQADATRRNSDIAEEAGVRVTAVGTARRELGLKSTALCRRDRRDEEYRAALSADPYATKAVLAERLGVSTACVSETRKRLGVPDQRGRGRTTSP